MNAFSAHAIKAYATIGVETGVVAASPHQLIMMLYDGAITAVAATQQHMRLKNTEDKGQAASKAISIIRDGLGASLQQSAGGDVAKNLSDLYQYMEHRLFQANLKNDSEGLEEVRLLLLQLRSAWQSMDASSTDLHGSAIQANFAAQPHRAATSYGSV
jgi:flagellar protein FliS